MFASVVNKLYSKCLSESSLKDIDETILDIPILEKSIQQNVPIMTIETYSESQISNRNENIPIIRLSNSENLSIQNILTSGKNLRFMFN